VLLNVSRSHLDKTLRKDPTFPRPVSGLGRFPRYRPEQIEAWIEARTSTRAEPSPG
jgi:predicted DNA-binding transcriptional regulator AlpA